MTKEQVAIADAIADGTKTDFGGVETRIRNAIINGLVSVFSADNPSFDGDLFTKRILVRSRPFVHPDAAKWAKATTR